VDSPEGEMRSSRRKEEVVSNVVDEEAANKYGLSQAIDFLCSHHDRMYSNQVLCVQTMTKLEVQLDSDTTP